MKNALFAILVPGIMTLGLAAQVGRLPSLSREACRSSGGEAGGDIGSRLSRIRPRRLSTPKDRPRSLSILRDLPQRSGGEAGGSRWPRRRQGQSSTRIVGKDDPQAAPRDDAAARRAGPSARAHGVASSSKPGSIGGRAHRVRAPPLPAHEPPNARAIKNLLDVVSTSAPSPPDTIGHGFDNVAGVRPSRQPDGRLSRAPAGSAASRGRRNAAPTFDALPQAGPDDVADAIEGTPIGTRGARP